MMLGREVDLLRDYPKAKRNLMKEQLKNEEDRIVARRFDKEFFDGERSMAMVALSKW